MNPAKMWNEKKKSTIPQNNPLKSINKQYHMNGNARIIVVDCSSFMIIFGCCDIFGQIYMMIARRSLLPLTFLWFFFIFIGN